LDRVGAGFRGFVAEAPRNGVGASQPVLSPGTVFLTNR
jgi:hypothetical protein